MLFLGLCACFVVRFLLVDQVTKEQTNYRNIVLVVPASVARAGRVS